MTEPTPEVGRASTIGQVPDDWYVLHGPDDTSLMWVGAEMQQTYPTWQNFYEAQAWCAEQVFTERTTP